MIFNFATIIIGLSAVPLYDEEKKKSQRVGVLISSSGLG